MREHCSGLFDLYYSGTIVNNLVSLSLRHTFHPYRNRLRSKKVAFCSKTFKKYPCMLKSFPVINSTIRFVVHLFYEPDHFNEENCKYSVFFI